MIFDYRCSKSKSKSGSWEGQVQLLTTVHPYEIKITARGSCFHIICGHYAHGNFLCIPTHGVATELAALTDTFWNLERLTNYHPNFSKTDAISIIYALKAISSYIDI
ncbi:DUF6618 family protein [Fusibacter sp. 3D3]|uniref:DUF6618 family protein n=2 Tax=Fusibacter sp. 3D3 TaxID=1048380 RepID=UPI000852956C|nr:DUF6618 family protein [Fusibacter sp. 3D3]